MEFLSGKLAQCRNGLLRHGDGGCGNQVQADPLDAARLHIDRFSGIVRQIDDAAIDDRSSIVHAHDNRTPVAQIGYFDERT